jgi:formyl-CoA transferase
VTDLTAALASGPGWPSVADGSGPLAGVRVLDLSRVLAGPYCCLVLADLGADVLKVERPGAGDDTRRWGPPFHGDDAAYFFAVNRDRRSLALDLTTDAGRAVVARLAEAADVVVENFLPRHLESLGLTALREQASAVWVSVRGAGGDGPDGPKPGYDVMAQARSGLMSVTGTTEPTKVGVAVADVVTGLYAAVGALAGLVAHPVAGARRATAAGRGRAAGGGGRDAGQPGRQRPGRRSGADLRRQRPPRTSRPYGPVPCADRPLVVGAGNDAQFARCAQRSGSTRPAWATNAGRVADRVALRRALPQVVSRRDGRGVGACSDAAGVPCAVVQDLASLPTTRRCSRTASCRRCRTRRGRCAWSGRRTAWTACGRACDAPRRCSGSTLARCCSPSASRPPRCRRSPVADGLPTGGEGLVAALRFLDVEVAFGLPGVHNLPLGRPSPAPASGWSACGTSRPRATPPTATPARRDAWVSR